MFNRTVKPALTRSFFLFGPRATGKSTLLKKLLPENQALWVDLLDPELEQKLARNPTQLSAMLEWELKHQSRPWVVIDEVQKIPDLLSIVQQYLQKKSFKFALTGSSARKLKRGAANLLGGRASWFELTSLNHLELAKNFNLDSMINWGSLPEIFELNDLDRVRFLKSYCNLYLKEEIVAEQIIRKVQPFRNFLELVALQNGQIINYSKFANDCLVDTTTVQSYFEILEDTLVGFILPPFHLSIRKRQRKNPKFYFFDTGVTRALAGLLESKIQEQTSTYGKYFEQFIITEIRRLAKSLEKDWRFSYLTTKDQAEIDLIIEKNKQTILIEIKSSKKIVPKEVQAFARIAQDITNARKIYLSQDQSQQEIAGVECLPWPVALAEILK